MPLWFVCSDVAMTTGAAASSSDADQALNQLSDQVAGKTPPTALSRQILWNIFLEGGTIWP